MSLRIRPMAALLYTLSLTILLVGAVLLFLLLESVDVLKDWKVTVPAGPHYPGETITVDSHYTKLRDVTGTAYRYIDCKNQRNTYTRYPVSSAPANNQSGTGRSTGIFVTIPSDITVPTTCHMSILIQYRVNALRTQPEFTTSNEFELISKPLAKAPTATRLDPVAPTNRPIPGTATTIAPTPQSTTINTSNNTTTNTSEVKPEQTCTVSVLGLKLLCN